MCQYLDVFFSLTSTDIFSTHTLGGLVATYCVERRHSGLGLCVLYLFRRSSCHVMYL